MLEVQLFDLGYCEEKEYTRVVCVSRYKGKYVFSHNKKGMVGKYLVDTLKKAKHG